MAYCAKSCGFSSPGRITKRSRGPIRQGDMVRVQASFKEPILQLIAEADIPLKNILADARSAIESIERAHTSEQNSKGSTNLRTRPAIIGALEETDDGIDATVYLLATFMKPGEPVPEFPKLVQHFLIPIYPGVVTDPVFPHLHTTPPMGEEIPQFLIASPWILHVPREEPLKRWRSGSNYYYVSAQAYTDLGELVAGKVDEWGNMDPEAQQDWAQEFKVCYPGYVFPQELTLISTCHRFGTIKTSLLIGFSGSVPSNGMHLLFNSLLVFIS